jgi:hypothetical protein
MSRSKYSFFFGMCALMLGALGAAPARAQMSEVKEKPRLFTYVAFWSLPRSQWADEQKLVESEKGMLDKSVAGGNLVAYGDDTNLIHQPDGSTHDDWFSSMSMAGLLNVLDGIYKSPITTSPVEASSTRHADFILVSRFYNWRPGSWKDVYSYTSQYTFKDSAPDDAVDVLSKNLIVPILEKAFTDGVINEYEIDTEAVHTSSPGTFYITYITAGADGVDKVSAAIRAAMKASPMSAPAFDSMIDYHNHRDYLVRTNATYK